MRGKAWKNQNGSDFYVGILISLGIAFKITNTFHHSETVNLMNTYHLVVRGKYFASFYQSLTSFCLSNSLSILWYIYLPYIQEQRHRLSRNFAVKFWIQTLYRTFYMQIKNVLQFLLIFAQLSGHAVSMINADQFRSMTDQICGMLFVKCPVREETRSNIWNCTVFLI